MNKESIYRVRPFEIDDREAINRVLSETGMPSVEEHAWLARWNFSPFAANYEGVPHGWVLETADGEIRGTLDNVHVLYELGGQPLKGAVAGAWAVVEAHRAGSLSLITTFLRQKNIDIALVVSASPTTAKVMTAMRIPRIPVPDYAEPCFWAVRTRQFAGAALARRGVKASAILAWPAGLVLWCKNVFEGSGRGRLTHKIVRVENFDDRFDALWSNLAAGAPRLRAVRTKEALRARFADALRTSRLAILIAEDGGRQLGYAVLLRRAGSDLDMDLYDIADLQAVDDNPEVIRNLLLGAIQAARQDGADAVKLMTGTPAKRSPAMSLKPFTYKLETWQLYYRAAPALAPSLGRAEDWDFSLFETY